MIPRSLSARLLLASVVVLPVFLGLSGYMLDLAFQGSLRAAEAERLKTHIYLLLGAAEMESGGSLWLPEALSEPRFAQLGSGLYGLVLDQRHQPLWRSPSSLLLPLPAQPEPVKTGDERFYEIQLNGEVLFAYDYDVAWEDFSGDDRPFRFTVLHTQAALKAELQGYRTQLWWWLGTLALLLLITQTLIMRWGLRPLRQLAQDLAAVESGQTRQLQGDYPDEIQSVTDNLNHVLSNEQAQRERYRNTLADLAHSLKTPLAVMRGSLDSADMAALPAIVEEQTSRMDQIVSHQLQRATLNPQPLARRQIAVEPLVTRLGAALKKVYRDKGITLMLAVNKEVVFQGDERDLLEVLGNLLENAFKYGKTRVHCSAASAAAGLELRVDDDGVGIPLAMEHMILQRGARADTAKPGQGIGLAVVVDIVSSYGGSISVGRSDLGGASFRVVFPAPAAPAPMA